MMSLTPKKIMGNRGLTLIEILVVLVIVILMASMGGVSLSPAITKRHVLNCGSNVITDVQLIRSYAQSEGGRAVFQLTSTTSPQDIDNDGIAEYYIGFIDKNGNGTFQGSTDTIILHGKNGNPLCNTQVAVDAGTSTRSIVFDSLGFLVNGAANKNIYFKASSTAVRVELVSITGMLRSYVNTDSCGGDVCSPTDTWEELK
jgi:prepilin-type N-terminal cleavage/methylation domain-containing protein